ncbi:HlyU family transcriptional regulator [Mesorhizobium sp. LHD-90]|uniref:HlyU family transcriptional regulator n=1 Tax=Mesorhizobium sp. LHD-90 TaxID=3071414 RepID=UPI0027E078E5|nr:HlyU family transcriptional regulator [Mesorhizobium sp. LHD-90]MDQ6436458.1 HlyU family transcriptional regulator [Mesorhizobium sp. LHD-90]
MSFLKRLFGGGGSDGGPDEGKPVGSALVHNGFTIRATPYKAEGQFQTCGVITKEIDGVVKEHRFVRADRFSSQDEAADMALKKGQQIVNEQGDRMFS